MIEGMVYIVSRHPTRIDISGQRFGMATVMKLDHITERYRLYWLCKCDCGKEFIMRGDLIKAHKYLNCGCYNLEKRRERQITHGYANTKLYHILYGMRQRCNNPNDSEYFRYGGRGIEICDEWNNNNETFLKWAIENGYKEGLSIERIDVNGNYCPENCKWIPLSEQCNNTRRTIRLKYGNKELNINQWARELGINKNTFWRYVRVKNYSIEYIIKTYCPNYIGGD